MSRLPTKSAELQAYYLRKREIEHQRNQRTQAVSRYYDHWDKVTTRHENWTTPEYYKQAEEKFQNLKSAKEKKIELASRQGKLRDLFSNEMIDYEVELKKIEKKRGNRSAGYATDILQKTEERLKQEENIRRKLEMEAKLYGKWRYGVEDEELLFKSKSDNQVLAKLNWLDKQIQDQMEKEKEEALEKEKALKLQEETRKIEEIIKERERLREKEISELRAMQEVAMEKLKEHKTESELLQSREEELKFILREIEKETEILDETTAASIQHADYDFRFSQKKVKSEIRQRSEAYRKQLQVMIDILERLGKLIPPSESMERMIEGYKLNLEKESMAIPEFEAMYESEAKQHLQRLDETWQKQTLHRYKEVKEFLRNEHSILAEKLQSNLSYQNELVDIRSTLLNSIDSSNERLKKLVQEMDESETNKVEATLPPPPEDVAKNPPSRETVANILASDSVPPQPRTARNFLNFSDSIDQGADKPLRSVRSGRRSQNVEDFDGDTSKLSNSFTNLNLVPSSSSTVKRTLPSMASSQSMAVVTAENAEIPKFGRKRVAWT